MDKSLVTIIYKIDNGSKICVEVSTPVEELLEQSDRQIRSQRRQDRRHLDFTVFTNEDLADSLSPAYEDTADLLEKKERDTRLHDAISKLSGVQRRRLYLYYFDGFNYGQIARIEGVSCQTVFSTIKKALEHLRKFIKNKHITDIDIPLRQDYLLLSRDFVTAEKMC